MAWLRFIRFATRGLVECVCLQKVASAFTPFHVAPSDRGAPLDLTWLPPTHLWNQILVRDTNLKIHITSRANAGHTASYAMTWRTS